MSRVVAMLLGDIQVSSEISKPGYLADWKFSNVSSLMTDNTAKGTSTSNCNSSTSTTMVNDTGLGLLSPVNANHLQMVGNSVREGR